MYDKIIRDLGLNEGGQSFRQYIKLDCIPFPRRRQGFEWRGGAVQDGEHQHVAGRTAKASERVLRVKATGTEPTELRAA